MRVSYDLIQRATAVGVLTIVYSLEFGKMDIYYFQALTSGNEKHNLSASMHGLPSGHYGVSVFSLEQGGLPFERSASSPKEIYVADTDGELLVLFNSELKILNKSWEWPGDEAMYTADFMPNICSTMYYTHKV